MGWPDGGGRRSPPLGCDIATAPVAIENGQQGAGPGAGALDGHMKRRPGGVGAPPFVDPKREKPGT